MRLTITPGKPLCGTARLPGDKSLSHRAAVLGALANGESQVENFLVSGVTRPMLRGLDQLGVAWELDGTSLLVQGKGLQGLSNPAAAIQCENSATTLRLLAGMVAAGGVEAVLDGSEGLRRRPMGRIATPLRNMGVEIRAAEGDRAPLRLAARGETQPLKGVEHRLAVASAQVKSCLLLAGLAADGPTRVIEPGPSRDHTERMLRSMGVRVDQLVEHLEGGRKSYQTCLVPPKRRKLPPISQRLPGDFSSAAFWIVAAIITPGSELCLEGVGINPTRTGLYDVLVKMGAQLELQFTGFQGGEPVGTLVIRHSSLVGTTIRGEQVVRMIDEFPIFAVAAAYAQGETRVADAQELRTKESDRIASLCGELRKMGVDARETADGFLIMGDGRAPMGGEVRSHGDHRLAMSLAAAGLAARGAVRVDDAEYLSESYPDFPDILSSLGGEVEHEG